LSTKLVNCNRSSPTALAANPRRRRPTPLAARLAGRPRSPAGSRRGMTPLCAAASYSIEYKLLRVFTAWGDQGPFEHPTRSPARPGTAPPCLIFPGVVQFSVSVFSASTFIENPPVVEICHFAGPPEAPTATADVAGGIPGWPRTRPATVRKLARSPRRLRHFPAGLLNRGCRTQLSTPVQG
jgi:hypothetical protein